MPASISLPPPRQRLSTVGASALPLVIIIAALAISGLVFFVFTRPAMKEKQGDKEIAEKKADQPILTPVPKEDSKAAAKAPAPPRAETLVKPAPPPPPPPAFGFARPQDLGKEMVRTLAAGDFDKAGKLAAAADPAQAETATKVFENMIKDLGVKVGREDQVEVLGMVENKTRLGLPLILPGQDAPSRIQIDVERDERMGWKIAGLHLPKELAPAIPAAPSKAAATPPTPPAPPAPAGPAAPPAAKTPQVTKAVPRRPSLFTVDEQPDALSFGSDFVRALLRHDFATARQFVDEAKVPAERLVGLCIVFEEGKYEFKPNKPMIITVANPEVSWVIAQVQSPSLEQSTEFGLELQRSGTDQPWKVVGLNLSEILSSFAASASKLGVPYTPIVTNPKGGESLALYFEYDKAQLHPRAQKQLEIVAGLLKSDPSKKLQINGHTDAKGTDDYNLRLSQVRAESVKTQLVALGVPASQVVTTGMGKAQPLGPNEKADGSDDPAGRSKNRRAEIFLDF